MSGPRDGCGVTIRRSGSKRLRSRPASWPVAITPSRPASASSALNELGDLPGDAFAARSAASRLVSTVTPRSLSALSPRPLTAESSALRSVASRSGRLRRAPRRWPPSARPSRRCRAAWRRRRRVSPRRQLARELRAAGEKKLGADLVDPGHVAETADEAARLRHGRHVQRDDQPIGGAHQPQNFRAADTSASTTPVSCFCRVLSARWPSSPKALDALGTKACSGMTSAPQPTAST